MRFLLFICFFLSLLPVRSHAQADHWAEVIARVSNSVVSLQVSQLRDFNHAEQGVGGATGFVVDAENGIILTNRHVIGAGPIRATATFQNQERIDLVPLYRDPVHDFGFLRYQPSDLQYIQPKSLSLRPDKVSTGMNIRVIGSDGGEQLSILAGTIARVDRKAPSYGRYEYNDFNTFYLQAASSTSGGSSGSPVLDADGDVVALNAAANSRTASSFFLPLDRIVRALELLQKNQAISRGTLQTLFNHRSFRELRRLGLDQETESRVRQANSRNTGLLVARQVLPGGAADGLLREGDILVSINDESISGFVALETILDSLVGETSELLVVRQGEKVKVMVSVADLHEQIPDRLLELGDTIIQDMSLQHVRGMNLEKRGVILVKPGFIFNEAGIEENALITSINHQAVNSLDDVLALLQQPETPERWLVRYRLQGREFFSELGQVELNHRWFRYRSCERKDNQRFWECEVINHPRFSQSESSDIPATLPSFNHPLLKKLAPAMVRVDFNIPYTVDNVFSQHFSGTGLIVDAESGLISIDRNTVPISMGEAKVTVFGSYEIAAEVVFLHPLHNLALLKYDPAELGHLAIPKLRFAEATDELPEDLYRLAFRRDGTYQINRPDNLNRATVSMEPPRYPRYQQLPLDVYTAANMPPSLGGPIVDQDGVIHAIWMSFAYEEGKEVKEAEWAMPVRILNETLKSYRQHGVYYAMDAMLFYRSLSNAKRLGLPDEWLQRYMNQNADQRRVLYVEQTVPGTAAAELLRPGDIVLTIEGQLMTDMLDAESVSQKPGIRLQVLRDREVVEIELKTSVLQGGGTRRIVSWGGAFFQEPHREIALYEGLDIDGVYITKTESGSPAVWDRLYRNRIVTEVNGKPVSGLDDFLEKVRHIHQDEFTRLTTVNMGGRRDIISVSPEYYFWPTFEIRRMDKGWQRIDYKPMD